MNRLAPLLALVLLGACAAPVPTRDRDARLAAYDARAETLGAWSRWGFTARLGVDAGDDGGSGRLDWSDTGARTTLSFRGALGQGAWRLQIEPGDARLELADGTVRRAGDVEELVWRETGWRLPVSALDWWIRGLAWPGTTPDRLELNDDGTPVALSQLGWRVEYSRFASEAGVLLPSRLEAVRDDVTVKLAVSRWRGDDVGGGAGRPEEGGDG